MHTVEMLESVMALAKQVGYHVRLEWLGGAGGGTCEFAGKKWLFVDLALSTEEQFEEVVDALRDVPELSQIRMSPCLVRHFRRRAA